MIELLFSPIVRCPMWLCHLISAAAGIVALTHFFYSSVVYILFLAFLSSVVIRIAEKTARGYIGPIVTAATIPCNVA